MRGGPTFRIHCLIWILGAVLATVLIFSDFQQLDGILLTVSKVVIGRDFVNVWSGGQLALQHNLANLYDYQGYINWQNQIFGLICDHNYSYPPHSLFLAVPFALVPYPLALILWTITGAIFFTLAAKPYLPKNLPAICAILTPAAMVNIWAGHYGFFIGGLWLFFFSALKANSKSVGIYAGFLTLKPHLGLLIALVMIMRRRFSDITVALISLSTLIIASGLIFGFNLWPHWLFDTTAVQQKVLTSSESAFYFVMMPTAFVAFREFPIVVASTVHGLFAMSALYLFWRAKDVELEDLAFISASVTAVILPYIFNYDLTVASLGFVICLYRHWGTLTWVEKMLLWLAFAVPVLTMINSFMGPILLLSGLIIQVQRAQFKNQYI